MATYRTATLRDVDGIAACAADAMMEDDLFGALYPRRKSDPSYFLAYFKRRARLRIVDRNIVTLIAELPVVENSGVEKKKIVGFAQWQKFGKESVETRWNPLQEMVAAFSRDFTELENIYWIKDGKDHDRWHLQLLGVHSTARRRGIGGALVQLGVEKAKRDNCDASLEASPMGLPLYQSRGFEVIGVYETKIMDPKGKPILSPVLLWKNPEIHHENANANGKA
ncbi:hypothetical protein ABW20_dc0101442 [Dactylellina cionopaga]|nr:hypothetical protein ABW20_dc0101442 [Dactylellina cionopaga]